MEPASVNTNKTVKKSAKAGSAVRRPHGSYVIRRKYQRGLNLNMKTVFSLGSLMDYVGILATGLYWYAVGGVAILVGTVMVYGLALLIHGLLARLITLINHFLSYVAGHGDVSLRRHHPFR